MLPSGLYEQVINQEIDRMLAGAAPDHLIRTEPIDDLVAYKSL
jgi:hypothetical protein